MNLLEKNWEIDPIIREFVLGKLTDVADHAEMKDYKIDLRLKYKDMSEDERVQFQAEFRDKVSDKRFAWISPQKQMLAGVSVDEIECREGLNLVLKTSNGKAMCVKSTTAEKLIEIGIAVPAA